MLKKLIIFVSSILLVSCIGGQDTVDREKQIVSTEIFYEAQEMTVNYDMVNKKASKKKRCYIVIEIITMPGENNMWYVSGFRKGDYIVLYGNRPGFMAELPCYKDNKVETVQRWFFGKAKVGFMTKEGWTVERLRINDDGSFSLKTVVISIYNTKERYLE